MAKKVFYDDDARQRVLAGAKELYEAVKVTMGPKGRNVVIGKSYGNPTVTHDGVTVAKNIEIAEVLDDKTDTLGYSVGAQLIKEAANKLNDLAGDGTTTVTVLTYHLLDEANKLIAARHNPMELRKGVEEARDFVLAELEKLKEEVGNSKDRITEVATISAGDPEIGTLIASVIDKVGKDGVVTVEQGQGLGLESEVVEGFTFDRGFVSPYMVTDTARMEAIYDKPSIVITDKKISSVQELLPLLEKLAQAGKKDLVLIADDVEGEAMGTLILNKLKGVFNTIAIKAPAFGDRRKDILEDIAILTDAQVITDDRGMTFENVELDVVGTARKVIVTKDETTIIEGGAKAADINARIKQITSHVSTATSEYDKENLEKRRAALQGKVAVIKVGGATETEIEEKKYRVDDAVAATKAALAEGIVAGGGVTLVDLSKKITERKDTGTNAAGWALVREALQQPFVQLLTNAGIKGADAKLEEVLNASGTGHGFDVNHPEVGIQDLKKIGIIDPATVTKEVIRNAISIAATAMTMGALVVDIPEPKSPSPDMSAMGGGMMGM